MGTYKPATKGPQKPELYTHVGPRYLANGEQPGFRYDPNTDRYYQVPQNYNVTVQAPSSGGIGQTLTSAGLGAGIKGGINAIGNALGGSAAGAGNIGVIGNATGEGGSAVGAGASGAATNAATGASLGWMGAIPPALIALYGLNKTILDHQSTEERQASKWGQLAEKSQNPAWKKYVADQMALQHNLASGSDTGASLRLKNTKVANPFDVSSSWGFLNAFGPDVMSWDADRKNRVAGEMIKNGMLRSEGGDVSVLSPNRAKIIANWAKNQTGKVDPNAAIEQSGGMTNDIPLNVGPSKNLRDYVLGVLKRGGGGENQQEYARAVAKYGSDPSKWAMPDYGYNDTAAEQIALGSNSLAVNPVIKAIANAAKSDAGLIDAGTLRRWRLGHNG